MLACIFFSGTIHTQTIIDNKKEQNISGLIELWCGFSAQRGFNRFLIIMRKE